ncbi:hypothetical protein JW968_03525 [Candidatus Woesearchaeota archaeon]|nr:hypothetical protein [Candidatus Woesearchaeota archaeon]
MGDIDFTDIPSAYKHIKHVHSKKYEEGLQKKYLNLEQEVRKELEGGIPAPEKREAHVRGFMKKYFGKMLSTDFDKADEDMIDNLYNSSIVNAVNAITNADIQDIRQAYQVIKDMDQNQFSKFVNLLPQAVQGEHLSKKRKNVWHKFYTAHEAKDIDRYDAQKLLYDHWEKDAVTPGFKENYNGDLKAQNIEALVSASLNYEHTLAAHGKKGRRELQYDKAA